MAALYKQARLQTKEPGLQTVVLTLDVTAGADPTQAFVFPANMAFAAAPRVLGGPVRVDNNTLDVAALASITALTAAGGTLRLKGTTTVQWTFDITFIGNLINPTAY